MTNVDRGARTSSGRSASTRLAGRDGRRHLDRQGVQAGERDGHDEGAPGADPARGEPRTAPSTRFIVRPVRQRARLARLGGPALPRADRARRAGHDHDAGDDALPAQPRRGGRHGLRGAARRPAGRDLRPARAGGAHRRRRRGADRRPRRSTIEFTGIRPGEKIHEILVSEEEAPRTVRPRRLLRDPADPARAAARGGRRAEPFSGREYSSADDLVDPDGGRATLLERHGMLAERSSRSPPR